MNLSALRSCRIRVSAKEATCRVPVGFSLRQTLSDFRNSLPRSLQEGVDVNRPLLDQCAIGEVYRVIVKHSRTGRRDCRSDGR